MRAAILFALVPVIVSSGCRDGAATPDGTPVATSATVAPAPTDSLPAVQPAQPGSSDVKGCYSAAECPANHTCEGCGPPPGCTENAPCPAVCYGRCVPAPPTSATPVPAKRGALTVNSRPWVQVWIDGKLVKQETPLLRYPLAAGTHDLRFVSPTLKVELTKEVVIAADEETSLFVDVAAKSVSETKRP